MTDRPAVEPAPPYRGRKPELYEQALVLRRAGCPVGEIAERLGVSKSTAYLWTRHLPLDPELVRRRRRDGSRTRADAQWSAHRAARDAARADTVHAAARWVRGLRYRELVLLLGASIYWCEGAKSKPWRRAEKVQFINSDPGLLALFLRFLESCGVDRSLPTYRVSIHESADADAAVRWWVERLRLPAERFGRSTLKRHNPATVRQNTGDHYHGCLVITVPRSRTLYWRIEGMIAELFRIADESGSDSAAVRS